MQFGKDNTYWRLADSDTTVMPSVTCMDWLWCWYNQVAGVVLPSTALALVTNTYKKHTFTSPSAVSVKNNQYWREIRHNKLTWKKLTILCYMPYVRFAHSSICTVCDNADRITESATSVTEGLCSKATTVLLEWTIPKIMEVSLLHFYCIKNK